MSGGINIYNSNHYFIYELNDYECKCEDGSDNDIGVANIFLSKDNGTCLVTLSFIRDFETETETEEVNSLDELENILISPDSENYDEDDEEDYDDEEDE